MWGGSPQLVYRLFKKAALPAGRAAAVLPPVPAEGGMDGGTDGGTEGGGPGQAAGLPQRAVTASPGGNFSSAASLGPAGRSGSGCPPASPHTHPPHLYCGVVRGEGGQGAGLERARREPRSRAGAAHRGVRGRAGRGRGKGEGKGGG